MRAAQISVTITSVLFVTLAAQAASRHSSRSDAFDEGVSQIEVPAARHTPAPTFVTLDYPSSVFSEADGITSAGTIVGAYDNGDGNTHGFLYRQGTYVALDDIPGIDNVNPTAINERGDYVGAVWMNPFQAVRGFVHTSAGYSLISFPGALLTEAQSINSRGEVVGLFRDANRVGHAFYLSQGTLTAFDVPNATFTAAIGINDEGDIVGDFHYADRITHGYIRRGQQWETVDFPGALATIIYGINERDDLTGFFVDADGSQHGFVRIAGQFQQIDGPDSLLTQAYGINATGSVVGIYADMNFNLHGFVRRLSDNR